MVDPVAYLPQLRDRSLRLQQVMDDPDTPPGARGRIAAAASPGQLIQYKDTTDHRKAWSVTGLSGWIASQFGMKAQPLAAEAAGETN
jgi:hypothetical protein